MSDLDFERKHAEDLQRLRGFRLSLGGKRDRESGGVRMMIL